MIDRRSLLTASILIGAGGSRFALAAPAASEALADLERRQGGQLGVAILDGGVPPGWRVGDKTGSFGTTVNDVAALWPPQGRPRLVAAYYVGGRGTDANRKAVLAAVGRIASQL